MEDGDGDKNLEINSVHNLSSDTFICVKRKIKVERGEEDRSLNKKNWKLERTQSVSENCGP